MAEHNAVVTPCAICESIHQIQRHHIVYRSRGGGGGDNLIPLCADHHRMFTDEVWFLERLIDGGFIVLERETGEIVCRNLAIDDETTRACVEGLWAIQNALEQMRPIVPTFTNEQLRSAWDALGNIDHEARQLKMAILHTCWLRAPHGDRVEVLDSIGRMFGIGRAQVYDYIRVYDELAEELPQATVSTQFLIEATRGAAVIAFGSSKAALEHIETRKAEVPHYSVRDFKRDVREGGVPTPVTGLTAPTQPVVPTTSGRTIRATCQFCQRESDMVIVEEGTRLRVVS